MQYALVCEELEMSKFNPSDVDVFKSLASQYALNPSMRETVEGVPFAYLMGRGHNKFAIELINALSKRVRVLIEGNRTVVLFKGHHQFP